MESKHQRKRKRKHQRKLNSFLLYYLVNVLLTLALIYLKEHNCIYCSYFICLLPVTVINVFLGVTVLVLSYLYVKGEYKDGD